MANVTSENPKIFTTAASHPYPFAIFHKSMENNIVRIDGKLFGRLSARSFLRVSSIFFAQRSVQWAAFRSACQRILAMNLYFESKNLCKMRPRPVTPVTHVEMEMFVLCGYTECRVQTEALAWIASSCLHFCAGTGRIQP